MSRVHSRRGSQAADRLIALQLARVPNLRGSHRVNQRGSHPVDPRDSLRAIRRQDHLLNLLPDLPLARLCTHRARRVFGLLHILPVGRLHDHRRSLRSNQHLNLRPDHQADRLAYLPRRHRQPPLRNQLQILPCARVDCLLVSRPHLPVLSQAHSPVDSQLLSQADIPALSPLGNPLVSRPANLQGSRQDSQPVSRALNHRGSQ